VTQTLTLDQAFKLALVHQQSGRSTEAAEIYTKIIEVLPNHAEAHHLLGIVAHQTGQADRAVELIDRAIALSGTTADYHNSLGNVVRALGRHDDAITSFRRALALRPGYFEARYNLARTLKASQRLAEAAECYRTVVSLSPQLAEAHNDLGTTLQALGQLDEAAECFAHAVALKPDFADAINNLGNIHFEQDRFDDALAEYNKVVVLKPSMVRAHCHLGLTLRSLGRLSEAEASQRRALALDPDFAEAHVNLGSDLFIQGRIAEALDSYDRALALRPDFTEAHSTRVLIRGFDPSLDTATQQAEHKRWYAAHGVKLAAAAAPHGNDADPDRRLRVGYVSADFCLHSASYSFGPVLRHHDPAKIEIVCYSGTRREDDVTSDLRAAASLWRDTRALSDDAFAAQVRADRIDILVDLSGHTAGNRLPAFARKPAPVQVSAWGYAAGTGVAMIDAIFSDPVVAPASERHHFAERVVDLPCVIGYEAPPESPPVAASPSTTCGFVTFGGLHHLLKLSDAVLKCWAMIVRQSPDSRLLLKDHGLDDPVQQQRIRQAFAAHGISPDRLILLGGTPQIEHLAAYDQVDIALDPFPYGGGITTCEALWMGVPAVTLCGKTVTARVGASIMTALELGDWVAHSEEEYVALAVTKTRDLAALGELRRGIRGRFAASALGDPVRYTRAVEAAYRMLWREWCARARSAT
jgi:predicted O-linked N-acetylglucosamine transferase (SPINDLY family)